MIAQPSCANTPRFWLKEQVLSIYLPPDTKGGIGTATTHRMDKCTFEAYDLLGQTYSGVGEHEQAQCVYCGLLKWGSDPTTGERIRRLQELHMYRGAIREHTGRTFHRRGAHVETILEACCAGHAGMYGAF